MTIAQEPSQRQIRVSEKVRRIFSEMLMRGLSIDKRLIDASITVSEVRMSPDLKHAKVYIFPLGGKDPIKLLTALQDNQGYFRSRVARKAELRFAPRIKFLVDDTFLEADKINRLFASLDTDEK